jgi:type II secretory pathway pseudopilin PulG
MTRRPQYGYTYLTLLFAVAFMGAGLAAASSIWHTAQMREKERELLYVGEQYRKAIEAYYAQGKQYPKELVQLLRDQRVPGVQRYLRKLYRDPITGKTEWGFVKAPDGGIAGVHSLSDEAPFKQADFPKALAEFTGKTKYSDWKFAYLPQGTQTTLPQGAPGAAAPQGTPGATPAPGTTGTGSPQGVPGATSPQGTLGAASPATASPQGSPAASSPSGVASGSPQAPASGVIGAPQPATPRP